MREQEPPATYSAALRQLDRLHADFLKRKLTEAELCAHLKVLDAAVHNLKVKEGALSRYYAERARKRHANCYDY